MDRPLRIYQKSVTEQFEDRWNYRNNDDSLKLFHVTSVSNNRCRYSIAGYPSLYLGTSLDLCREEIHLNPHQDFALASIFKLERTVEYSRTNIQVVELGVKPQDFFKHRTLQRKI